MIDPFTYRTALTEPKLVVLGTHDDYTPTDALNLYWNDLPGPRSVLYLPNTTHAGVYSHSSVNPTAFAFVRTLAADETVPDIDWSVEIVGEVVAVRATPQGAATAVLLWTALPSGRDLRVSTWREQAMRQLPAVPGEAAGVYAAEVPLPAEGYAAFFVEAEFGDSASYKLTTTIQVIEGGSGRTVSRP